MPIVYCKQRSVRIATWMFAVMVAVTVLGLPIAVWLMVVAQRRVEVDEHSIAIVPFGRRMHWKDVRRFGIGWKTGKFDRTDTLTITTMHIILKNTQGQSMVIHASNLIEGRALLNETKLRSPVPPETLKTSFFLQRLSFTQQSK